MSAKNRKTGGRGYRAQDVDGADMAPVERGGAQHPDAWRYIAYLRRRVEDYPDENRPTPKWSELDHQAVAVVLNEVEWLRRFHDAASLLLQRRGLRVEMPVPGEPVLEEPARRGFPDARWQVACFVAGALVGGLAGWLSGVIGLA